MIVDKETVRAAVRALVEAGSSHEDAVQAVAQRFASLPEEVEAALAVEEIAS